MTTLVATEEYASTAQSLEGISTENLYTELIRRFDAVPNRDGLIDTPKRAAKAMRFLTGGIDLDPRQILQSALFDVDYNEMVIVRDIEMYSLCEHHMLPFFGKVHIGYVPQGKIIGLSKLPRMVDAIARRLQVQERITQQIADTLYETIKPSGVGVVIEAQHLCMMMRGVEKQHSQTVTSALLGCFKTQPTRSEFLSLATSHRQ
ncbi:MULTISPECIES: GTP cyclohydrolase I FolE [Acidobacteriaceae]|uniref:GTP cyclohydrolase I FolE n=1 Tax=Acidobacteriaceae TaxID=204434 RepID=UPI00131C823C|nr:MULTISPECIES: GTP cyclohydrolase I FolE [Acidobacteriaceae]MDW5266120.1 GTP cyclohydrolase I FolE [Edaphobacter sp.]